MSKIRQEMEEECSRFWELYQESEYSEPPGIRAIVVKEVLAVGKFWLSQPEIAIVRDLEDRLWRIPEAKLKGIVSRHDIKEGMSLRLTIGERGEISEILVRDQSIFEVS